MGKVATPYDHEIVMQLSIRKDMHMSMQTALPTREAIKLLHTVITELTFQEMQRIMDSERKIMVQ